MTTTIGKAPPADIFAAAEAVLRTTDVDGKLASTRRMADAWQRGGLSLPDAPPAPADLDPGLPTNLELVCPADLPRRSLGSAAGHVAFLHAIAHIEFVAINLAWDAVYRFRDMPHEYYDDWVQVAREEAYHFSLVRGRLRELGCDYGDIVAHDGLWDMARATADDALARMALVPRLAEARGLDVTPGIIVRLREAGDEHSAGILEVILNDEIGHVAVGSRWFGYVCRQRGLDTEAAFRELIAARAGRQPRVPLNRSARRQAGFTEDELDFLDKTYRDNRRTSRPN